MGVQCCLSCINSAQMCQQWFSVLIFFFLQWKAIVYEVIMNIESYFLDFLPSISYFFLTFIKTFLTIQPRFPKPIYSPTFIILLVTYSHACNGIWSTNSKISSGNNLIRTTQLVGAAVHRTISLEYLVCWIIQYATSYDIIRSSHWIG